MRFLIKLIIGIATVVAILLFEGWALSVLWRWFVVQLGPPPIGVLHATGLTFVASVVRYRWRKMSNEDTIKALASGVFNAALCVALGYLIHAAGATP